MTHSRETPPIIFFLIKNILHSEYGITDYEDKHRLKGPGLDPEVGKGGVSHMGGKWPGRLSMMCSEIVGEFEDNEMELYMIWKNNSQELLEKILCRDEMNAQLSRCLNVAEQGELVRDDIEDMMKTMNEKEEL